MNLALGAQVGNYRPTTNLPAGDGQWGRGEQFTPVIIVGSLHKNLWCLEQGVTSAQEPSMKALSVQISPPCIGGLGPYGRVLQAR